MQSEFQRIGSILREKREEKGLSIIDISDLLCIRKSLVQALEEGNTSMLPHAVYIRGYLKKYAHILDISEETLGFDARVEEQAVKTQTESEPGRITSAIHKPRHIAKRAIVVPLILVLIIAFFVLNQIYKERSVTRSGQDQAAQSNPVSTKQASINVRGPSAANTPTDAGAAEQSRVMPASEIKKLMITCNERTWVSVVIDDSEKKEFMLNPEEMIVLNAKENFDLLIGNAAGVKLNLNGKEVGFTGKNGEVKRVKIS
jgi:cytoskeletal protein RodZ